MSKLSKLMVMIVVSAVGLVNADIILDEDFKDQTIPTLQEQGWTFGGEVTPAGITEERVRTYNGDTILSLDCGDPGDPMPNGSVHPQAGYPFGTSVQQGVLAYNYSNSNSYSNTHLRVLAGTTEVFSINMVKDSELRINGSETTSISIADNTTSATSVTVAWDADSQMILYTVVAPDGTTTKGEAQFAEAGSPDAILCELMTETHNSREWYLYNIKIESAAATTTGSPVVMEEGQTADAFDVVLLSEPAGNVTANVSAIDPNDIKFDAGGTLVDDLALEFTPANWSTPQTVTVQAIDDTIVEGDEIIPVFVELSSTDPNVASGIVIPQPKVQVIDNDQGSVIITESDDMTEVSEQGPTSDTYTLTLSDYPTGGSVTLDVVFDAVQLTVDPAQIVLDSSNWSSGVEVTVTAVDDDGSEPEPENYTTTISHTLTNTSPIYNGVTVGDITATILNNDCDGPFSISDFNHDCITNIADLAVLAGEWLQCTVDNGYNCL